MKLSDWVDECRYIARVTDKQGSVREMNNDKATFIRYCEMMRDQAEREGFFDSALYIQECLDDLAFDCPLCGQHITDGKPCGCGAR